MLVHEVDDALPREACSGRYIPVQPGEMRPSRVTQVISVNTRPAPPNARVPKMHQMEIVGNAVDRAVHIHG